MIFNIKTNIKLPHKVWHICKSYKSNTEANLTKEPALLPTCKRLTVRLKNLAEYLSLNSKTFLNAKSKLKLKEQRLPCLH
jgi:hypothetical protein